MITVYVLVVWFGFANAQTSFSVNDIATQQECQRLGQQLKKEYRNADVKCFPYRRVK